MNQRSLGTKPFKRGQCLPHVYTNSTTANVLRDTTEVQGILKQQPYGIDIFSVL